MSSFGRNFLNVFTCNFLNSDLLKFLFVQNHVLSGLLEVCKMSVFGVFRKNDLVYVIQFSRFCLGKNDKYSNLNIIMIQLTRTFYIILIVTQRKRYTSVDRIKLSFLRVKPWYFLLIFMVSTSYSINLYLKKISIVTIGGKKA